MRAAVIALSAMMLIHYPQGGTDRQIQFDNLHLCQVAKSEIETQYEGVLLGRPFIHCLDQSGER